jgi:hypothetical protein
MRLLLAAALWVSFIARADPPTPEEIAKIQHEQEKATAELEKKYGNRRISELSNEERRTLIKERADAEREVLDKHGVDPKDFARATAKQSLEDRAKTRTEREKLKADADKKPDEKKDEVIIERGHTAEMDAEEAAEMDKAAGFNKTTTKKKKK